MITLQGLLYADVERLRSVAGRWQRLATTVDATVEDLGRATHDLPHHWFAGPAAEAAQERGAALRAQVGNAYAHCTAIAAAVRGFADELDQHQRMLDTVVREAETGGLRIDLGTGRITVSLDRAAVDPRIDTYAHQISEIVAAANEADRRAVEVLTAHQYREELLPTAEVPEYDAVAVLALAEATPSARAQWWLAQHPLNQERAIAEHPAIIGAAQGLPTRDRDAANRLQLSRTKEALLAARDRHEQLRGGHDELRGGSRAAADVDDRLAAVAELEARLPGWELLDYRPGAERDAILTSPAGARWTGGLTR